MAAQPKDLSESFSKSIVNGFDTEPPTPMDLYQDPKPLNLDFARIAANRYHKLRKDLHIGLHPSKNAFTFYEPRYGDTYNVFLDSADNFEVAYRYISGRNDANNILTYDTLELPAYHRKLIEEIIWNGNRNPNYNRSQ